MQLIENTTENKNYFISRKNLSLKEKNNEKGYFEGILSTGDIDRDGEITNPEAFKKFINKSMPFVYEHKIDRRIGTAKITSIRNNSVFVEGKIDVNQAENKDAKLVYDWIKEGTMGLSFGARVLNTEMKKSEGKMIRVIDEIDLIEMTATSAPANSSTGFLKVASIKNNSNLINIVANETLKLVNKFKDLDLHYNNQCKKSFIDIEEETKKNTNSIDKPSSEYKKYFLLVDEDNLDSFDSYKLQLAENIEKRILLSNKLIQKAIQEVDILEIEESERQILKSVLNNLDLLFNQEKEKITIKELVNKKYESLSEIQNIMFETINNRRSKNICEAFTVIIKNFLKKEEKKLDNKKKDNTIKLDEVAKLLS